MPADEPPIRVLIADDDARFRHAVEAMLATIDGFELVGSAADGSEAVRLFAELRPDAVLMDVVMPLCDGIQATKQILAVEPAAWVIALTGAEDLRMLGLCLAAGAKGCLRKGPGAIALIPLMLALGRPEHPPDRASADGGAEATGSAAGPC
jgi:DNA-binding NarL/FixJ family response regulator